MTYTSQNAYVCKFILFFWGEIKLSVTTSSFHERHAQDTVSCTYLLQQVGQLVGSFNHWV